MKSIILLITLSISTVNAKLEALPLDTVNHVDLNRYLGKWYEIARFEHSFQKGCTAVTAQYSMRKDGHIKVINSCRKNSPKGKLKKAKARAWVTDKVSNSKLKVQFFLTGIKIPKFAGNYWILDLDKDYQYAIIGDPSRQYLWFLSRTSIIENSLYQELIKKAQDMHFDTTKLQKTIH